MDQNYLPRAEHEEFARRMTTENERLKDEDNRQNRRIEQLETTVNQIVLQQLTALTGTIQALQTSVETTIKDQAAIGERVKKLEDRDGDMWRTAVKYVLSAVIGGLVTFAFVQLGVK